MMLAKTSTITILAFICVATFSHSSPVFQYLLDDEGLNATISRWFSTVNQLNSFSGPQLDPDEVLVNLKVLDIIHNGLRKFGHHGGEYELRVAKEVRELIGVSEGIGDRCDLSSFERFHELLEYHPIYKNLIAYIRHQNLHHLTECQSQIDRDLDVADRRIKLETRAKARLLFERISQANKVDLERDGRMMKHELDFSKISLRNGMMDFVATYTGSLEFLAWITMGKRGKILYERKLKGSVGNLCNSLLEALGPTIEIYHIILKDYNSLFMQNSTNIAKELIAYGITCKRIKKNFKSFVDSSYKMILKEKFPTEHLRQ